ncbi:MAG: NPCBM/NEW2 domain-containing protein [Acidimicrobiales bacterium]
MPAPWRFLRTAASALAIALVAAACGGGDDSPSGTATDAVQSTTTTAGVTSTQDTTSSTTRPGTVESTRSTVATTTTAVPAEVPLDRNFVPENTGLDFSFGQTTVNGVAYTNALVMSLGSGPGRLEINAGRDRTRFLGDLGIPDDQPSATAVQVEISLDDAAPVLSTQVRFGETKKIDLDVTGVLRIKISVSNNRCCPRLAIGSPRFVP